MLDKTEGNQKESFNQNNDIPPEKLKHYKGFENLTDDQASKICAFTIQYCSIVHESITHLNIYKP